MKALKKLLLIFIIFALLISCATNKSVDSAGLIGIAWRSDSDSEFYTNITKTLDDLNIPYVMVDQVVDYSLSYNDGTVSESCIDENGILLSNYAELIKSEVYRNSNIEEVINKNNFKAIIFTGGEDIAPTLLKTPEPWHGIEEEKDYNATRDVSDYLLMSYCLDNNIPVIGFCRGSQMLGVVSGAGIIQDLRVYFNEQNVEYNAEHRNDIASVDSYRDYAPHDVKLIDYTKVKEIFDRDTLNNVPSWHHQVLTALDGTNLILAGYTDVNGITTVEIIERSDKDFAFGFQFHPEASYVKHLEDYPNKDDFLSQEDAAIIFKEIGKLL